MNVFFCIFTQLTRTSEVCVATARSSCFLTFGVFARSAPFHKAKPLGYSLYSTASPTAERSVGVSQSTWHQCRAVHVHYDNWREIQLLAGTTGAIGDKQINRR